MDKIAIVAAQQCLERAKQNLDTFESAATYQKMEESWAHFLTMANRVYVKLEQGSKISGPSKGWFGRKKHERRSDPLLAYVKNARDADEHGLQNVTDRTPASLGVKFPTATNDNPVRVKSGVVKSGPVGAETSFELEDENTPVEIRVIPPSVRLVEVTNFGDRYRPPTTHLGQPVDPQPLVVGRLMVTHLEQVIQEAEKLTG